MAMVVLEEVVCFSTFAQVAEASLTFFIVVCSSAYTVMIAGTTKLVIPSINT